LRGTGLDPLQRVAEGDIWVGYWVYLAAIPSLADAETILARLKESGIAEAYVIPSSDSGILISLGVFTEVARAGNRLSAARELGYEATISDRTRRGTVYWVDVLLAPGETLDFDALQPPGRIVRLEQRPCADTLQ
jgi:cell division septation protein DedD